MKTIFLSLFVVSLLGSCATAPAPQAGSPAPSPDREIVFARTSSPGVWDTFITVKSSGEIRLSGTAAPLVAHIDPAEASSIIDRATSKSFQKAASRAMQANGADLDIRIGSSSFQFSLAGRSSVPAEVVALLERVDALVSPSFGTHYRPLAPQR